MMPQAAIALLSKQLDELQRNLKDNEVDGAEDRRRAQIWDDQDAELRRQADEILAAINTLENA